MNQIGNIKNFNPIQSYNITSKHPVSINNEKSSIISYAENSQNDSTCCLFSLAKSIVHWIVWGLTFGYVDLFPKTTKTKSESDDSSVEEESEIDDVSEVDDILPEGANENDRLIYRLTHFLLDRKEKLQEKLFSKGRYLASDMEMVNSKYKCEIIIENLESNPDADIPDDDLKTLFHAIVVKMYKRKPLVLNGAASYFLSQLSASSEIIGEQIKERMHWMEYPERILFKEIVYFFAELSSEAALLEKIIDANIPAFSDPPKAPHLSGFHTQRVSIQVQMERDEEAKKLRENLAKIVVQVIQHRDEIFTESQN